MCQHDYNDTATLHTGIQTLKIYRALGTPRLASVSNLSQCLLIRLLELWLSYGLVTVTGRRMDTNVQSQNFETGVLILCVRV